MSCENCDFLERLRQLQETKPEERLYGKRALSSHKKYSLYSESDDMFDITNIMRLYSMFTYNVFTLLKAGIFKYKWVNPNKLLTATKGKIWDWSSDEEKEETIESIRRYGLHFPIFTLDKGILHNQVDPLKPGTYENKYNSYNGNHRIDAIQSMKMYDDKEVLIIIMPEFCEKSCNGFRYTYINYSDIHIPQMVIEHPLPTEVKLFHLRNLEDEMKMYNVPTANKDVWPGIDFAHCLDYQCAFRILQEFQNALEVPLTKHYKRCMEKHEDPYTSFIDTAPFNSRYNFELLINKDSYTATHIQMLGCPFSSNGGTCFLLQQGPRICDKMICCRHCPKKYDCEMLCYYLKP